MGNCFAILTGEKLTWHAGRAQARLRRARLNLLPDELGPKRGRAEFAEVEESLAAAALRFQSLALGGELGEGLARLHAEVALEGDDGFHRVGENSAFWSLPAAVGFAHGKAKASPIASQFGREGNIRPREAWRKLFP